MFSIIGEAIVEFVGAVIGEFLVQTVLFGSLNFIGGTLRWIYGSIWRTILRKKKYKFKEYINGPDEPSDWHDANHRFVNILIAILVIIITIVITL